MFPTTASSLICATSECSLHQPTGSFCYESSLTCGKYSSTPHNPIVALASHCIRVAFGERVQWVADGLYAMGGHGTTELSAVTFKSLRSFLLRKQESVRTYCPSVAGHVGQHPSLPRTPPVATGTKKKMEEAALRASLLVMVQHSIVSVGRKTPSVPGRAQLFSYRYHPERAVRLGGCRYARYVEYVKRALQDPIAATVVETLLLHGRLRTVDLVVFSVHQKQREQQQNPDVSHSSSSSSTHHKYTVRETIVDALAKLVRGGFLEHAPQTPSPLSINADHDQGENEFVGDSSTPSEPPQKMVKLEMNSNDQQEKTNDSTTDEDPAVVTLLKSNAQYRSTLPIDTVWRVNQGMFHDSLRALRLGRLVADLYNHRVRWSGPLVTSALKYRAHIEHALRGAMPGAPARSSDSTFFTPNDVIKYLPKSVMQEVENEASKIGANAAHIIHKAFLELSEIRHPSVVVRRVGEDSFEIAHASLLEYLRRRIIHQVVEDRHGQIAARIVSISNKQGWLESDHLANFAMVPAKDTRAILHELYRSRYIDLNLMTTSQSAKQSYNPNATVFLWSVDSDRLRQKVIDDVLTATRNLSVRRQHEWEVVGREWIERAQRQTQEDENEHATDKVNYQKFCLGLERIDVALQELDETLLALADFG